MIGPVEQWDSGPDEVEQVRAEAEAAAAADDDAFDDLVGYGTVGGSLAEARRAGDDSVDGLEKITAQMAGGEHRPEQQEMCRAVAEAIVTGTHLVVQAGTGTGKSLAYLVPA